MILRAFWFVLIVLMSGMVPLLSYGEIKVGTEGACEKRETGEEVFLPQGWVHVSLSHFPTESFSLFGDFSAKGGWDTGMEKAPYDISGFFTASLRGESLFIGFDTGVRGVRTFDTSRQVQGYVAPTVSYSRETFSLFLKPFLETIRGPTDSVTGGLEPGLELLLLDSWVGEISFRSAFTHYSDASKEYSLEPRISLDWYPAFPFSTNLRGGWTRQISEDDTVLEETFFGVAGFLWYPRPHIFLKLDITIENVYHSFTLDEQVSLGSTVDLRIGLPGSPLDVLVGGGYKEMFYTDRSETEDTWLFRIGLEITL
ncbi:MAG TPA: hypothetical protein PLG79_01820 [Spirochaetales bacterium]|nr:hypothetical protein [Spirochaetales bacterium]HOV37431.1 hypothetical protein [Spirochaetales bacterium]